MRFIRTAKMRTDPLGQLLCRKQASGFNHGLFSMHPFGFDWIEPGALRGKLKGQNPHAVARHLDLLVVLSDPSPHQLADMPGSVVPDHQPGSLALRRQPLTAPVEKLGGDGTDRPSADKAKPHRLA